MPASEALEKETDTMVDLVVQFRLDGYKLPKRKSIPPECNPVYVQRLCNIIQEVESKHQRRFENMYADLELSETTAYAKFLGVTSELFKNGVKWSKIMSLLAFSSFVVWKCQETGLANLVPSLKVWVKRLFKAKLLGWMEEQGGWDDWYDTFSGTLPWKMFVKLAGLTAIITLLSAYFTDFPDLFD